MRTPATTARVSPRRIVVLALILQFALLAIGYWSNRSDDLAARSDSFRQLTTPPPGQSPSIESALPAALDYARTWSPGAWLFAAAMQIDWLERGSPDDPVAISPTGWILLTFATTGGEGENQATLSVMIDRVSGYVLDERAMPWSRAPERAVDPAALAISSDVALFASELTGGRDFRLACPEHRRVSRIGLVPAIGNENPYWLVTYEDARDSGRPAFEVAIDGMTGDVRRASEPAHAGEPCA